MSTYYNENDPKAAAWLRELIKSNLIAPGDVDERSIADVNPYEIRHYTQHHFFAGIGGWSYALRLAGWPDERPVVTGSCPCQPFSQAGEGLGTADSRHLWPVFRNIFTFLEASIILGEQVTGAIKMGWLDAVKCDVEGQGYAFGCSVLPASAFGADHQRNRIYWVADSRSPRRERREYDNRVSCGENPSYSQPCDPFTMLKMALESDIIGLLSRDGVSLEMERCAIKGCGNAIVPEVAAEFIKAVMAL